MRALTANVEPQPPNDAPLTPAAVVRLAALFYGAVTLFAIAYASVFGFLDRLWGERAATPPALFEALAAGLSVVALSRLAHHALAFVRRATEAMGELLGPLGAREAVVLALLSGFGEELVFRGALWPHLGLWGTSALFAVCHWAPIRSLRSYPLFVFCAGLLLGWLRERSGSLWPPILLHVVVNAFNLSWIGSLERTRASGGGA